MAQVIPDKPTLLSLPQEMRDLIHYFTYHNVEVNLKGSTLSSSNAGLLATCHQLRTEAMAVYYKESAFTAEKTNPAQLIAISRQLPAAYVPTIRTLRISVTRAPSTISFGCERDRYVLNSSSVERLLGVDRESIKGQLKIWRELLGSLESGIRGEALQGSMMLRDGVEEWVV